MIYANNADNIMLSLSNSCLKIKSEYTLKMGNEGNHVILVLYLFMFVCLSGGHGWLQEIVS